MNPTDSGQNSTGSPASSDQAPGSLQRNVRRRWLYEVTDWNDDASYVDEAGNEVLLDDAKEHIATDSEAGIEADRRADLWETKQDAFAARVTSHSQGIVREPPNAARHSGDKP